MYKKMFLFLPLFFLFSCSGNNENLTPQNNTPDIEVTKVSDLDLVKKYFDYLSKKDYLSAYNLKKTDKTLDDYKSIYSDSESFIKYSSEKLDNGNIKSINIIDNIPYEGIFDVVDGKIKTVLAGEMRDYFYDKSKKELVSKNFVSYSFDNFSLFPPDSYNKIEYYTFFLINENFVNNNYSGNLDGVLQSVNEQKNKKYFVDINDPDCYFLTCPISLFGIGTENKEHVNLRGTIFNKINKDSLDKLEKFPVKNILKKVKNEGNISIYIEKISTSPYYVIHYNYKLTDNFKVSYFGIIKEEDLSIENIKIKPKKELIKELTKINNELIKDNKGKYYTFKNSIWHSDGISERLILSDGLPGDNTKKLTCSHIGNLPVMKCFHSFFENYNPEYRLFFKESERYLKMQYDENCNESWFNNFGKSIGFYCNDYSSGEKSVKEYDFKGGLLDEFVLTNIKEEYISINGESKKTESATLMRDFNGNKEKYEVEIKNMDGITSFIRK